MDRKALCKISYGLYIVCSKNNGKINGQIANSIFQVTAEPPTIAISINKLNLTHEYITKSKLFRFIRKNTNEIHRNIWVQMWTRYRQI
jgi:flavin reductase (DIM6/NTAB) family NADH-FMN oxidoreductase RutF